MAGAFLVAFCNAAASTALIAVNTLGIWGAAFALFNVSAVVWIAVAAALHLAHRDGEAGAARSTDWVVLFFVIAAAMAPWSQFSGVALTVAAAWAAASSAGGSALRRAGVILLAVTGAVLWGNLLLIAFSRPVLQIDIWLMGHLLGVNQEGNVLWRDGGEVTAVVATGCSSLHGVSIALVCWTTISQWFQATLNRRALLTLGAAIGATVLINILRMGAILISPQWAHVVHDGWGVPVVTWMTLAAVVGACFVGFRREIFASP